MEEFDKVYSKIYQDNYDELERLRKKSKKRSAQVSKNIYGMLIFFVIEAMLLKFNIGWSVLFLFIALILMIVLIINSFNRFKGIDTYNIEYQKRVITPLIQVYDNNVKYYIDKGIDVNDYKNLGYINDNIFFESNNLMEKQLNNAIIKIAYVNTEKIRIHRGEQIRTKDFSGLFIKITYNVPNSKINLSEIKEICNNNPFKFTVATDERTIYLSCKCGNLFKGNLSKSSLDKETIYNSYSTLKMVLDKSTMIANKFI